MEGDGKEEPSVTTITRGFRLFELIQEMETATLSEITREVDVSKSTVHRYLKTLEQGGFLYKDHGEYRLGLRFLKYGWLARNGKRLWTVGKSRVDALSSELEERVWIVIREGDYSYHAYLAEPGLTVSTPSTIGDRRLLHQSSAGKAILGELNDDHVETLIDRHGLPGLTPKTITDPGLLFDEVKQIREQGFATSIEESIEGISGIGMAVNDPSGSPIGGLSVTGPTHRFTDDYMVWELADPLRETVNEVGLDLKYDKPR